MPISYCNVDDIPAQVRTLNRDVNVQQEIYTIAEEMDAKIGIHYQLPLQLSPQNPRHQPFVYMLKKANKFGVVGNLVIRAGMGKEDNDLNAYGRYHLRHYEEFLEAVCSGKIKFPDQQVLSLLGDGAIGGPFAFGPDEQSRVEPFYDPSTAVNRPWVGAIPTGGAPWV